ncbi:hypothetical protein GTY65_34165, partial [Streptomyces sp. SID8379]|uniref:hypothetical protein n=1 Tax=unclassified Streptomyces TaxID=2593676 RepID=UPI0005BB02F5
EAIGAIASAGPFTIGAVCLAAVLLRALPARVGRTVQHIHQETHIEQRSGLFGRNSAPTTYTNEGTR